MRERTILVYELFDCTELLVVEMPKRLSQHRQEWVEYPL